MTSTISWLKSRIWRMRSSGIAGLEDLLDVGNYSSESVLRAVRSLVREGLVATYYRVPKSLGEWKRFTTPRREKPGAFYPPLHFYRIVAVKNIDKAYRIEKEYFAEKPPKGSQGDINIYLIDKRLNIEQINRFLDDTIESKEDLFSLPAFTSYKGPVRITFNYMWGRFLTLMYYEPLDPKVLEMVIKNYNSLLKSYIHYKPLLNQNPR